VGENFGKLTRQWKQKKLELLQDIVASFQMSLVLLMQKTATRWSGASVNINLDDLGQQSKTLKTAAAPTMKQLQEQSSTPVKGFHILSGIVLQSGLIRE